MSKSAVDSWIKEFKNICTYWRIRGKGVKLFSPEKVIFKKTFSHQIPYKFQYHQAKLKMFIKDYFSELARYLKDTPKKWPDKMFLSGEARGSRIKLDFPVEAKRKTNYACRLAGLALTMTKNNRERHEIVQDFILANDTATLACEVPVYLYCREAGVFGLVVEVLRILCEDYCMGLAVFHQLVKSFVNFFFSSSSSTLFIIKALRPA